MTTLILSPRLLRLWLAFIAFFLSTLACSLAGPAPVTSSPAPSPTMDSHPAVIVPPSLTPEILEPTVSQAEMVFWAMQSFSDSSTADPDWANGEPDVTDCTAPMLTTWAPLALDQPETLTLAYSTPILASQLDIFYIGQPGEILRVEVQNSLSGLGQLIHDGEKAQPSLPGGRQCPAKLSLPVKTDFEVDLVIITIAASAQPVQIDAVGLIGELLGYLDLPVFWRVPLPATPVSLAAGTDGLIYAATAPHGLYAYDVEGNQLREFTIPSDALLTDVTTDSLGNPLIIDDGFGWFVLMSPEGEQLTVGGDGLYGQAAVNPSDGNLYILKDKTILVYTTDTAELLREMSLDEGPGCATLAFDPQGRLFTLRSPEWQPELLQLDPQTGAELDAIPLARANQYPIEIVARDLAIDASGNFYVLFGMNTGQIAVHVLDPQGNFLRRFGRLTSNAGDWSEGAFLDPRTITVTPDGRFILVADGYDETSYLTAFLMEPEQ